MKFAELPPSEKWAALKYKGETIAEVWFKPDGEPLALTFRIPEKTFQTPGMGPGLTMENLLKSVGIAPEEVESWRHGDFSHSGRDGSNPEFKEPLPSPSPDTSHFYVHVILKPPLQADTRSGGGEPEIALPESKGLDTSADHVQPPRVDSAEEGSEKEIASTKWQDLESRWNAILALEATIETQRLALEGVRVELEALAKNTLTPEERLHARKDDVSRWTRERTRIHFVLPKLKEFVHRATWAVAAPERKLLDEHFKETTEPQLPVAQMIRIGDQLENLLKDRQVLSAQGVTVQQECQTISANIHESLRILQSNAAVNKNRKQRGIRGGKFFKDVRRLSGLE
jgi:hypothetical protein